MMLRKWTSWCYTSLLSCSVHFSFAPFSIPFNAMLSPLSPFSLCSTCSLCSRMIGQLVKVPFLQDRLYSKIQQLWYDFSYRDQLEKHCSQAHRIILYLSNLISAVAPSCVIAQFLSHAFSLTFEFESSEFFFSEN